MKRFVLFLLVLVVWVVTYYHPKPETNEWTEEVYKTTSEPKPFKTKLKLSHPPVPIGVWEVTLDDGTKLYLPIQWTMIREE